MITKKQAKLNAIDKSFTSFIFLIAFLIIALLLLFVYLIIPDIHFNLNIRYFTRITLIAITASAVFILLFIIGFIVFVYNTRHVPHPLKFLSAFCLIFIFPILITLSEIFKKYNQDIRAFYINFNNISVKSGLAKYKPDDVMILLPHCLQNSSCIYKVTNNVANCRMCMKCDIGNIRLLANKYSVSMVEIVSGGTAARNSILRLRPKIIIAIACERDLASGIADVRRIPAIGILNKRPNGPCVNTTLCNDELISALDSVVS